MSTKLFPPYLDQGSTGTAVNVLGLLLKATNYETIAKPIVLDGEYTVGGAIAEGVKFFQRNCFYVAEDVDGNFGPKTREAFKKHTGIDVDTLTVEMFTMPTIAVGPKQTA